MGRYGHPLLARFACLVFADRCSAQTFPGYEAVFPASAAVTGKITFTKSDHDSPYQIVASLTQVAGAHSPAW
jgi:hypothetical protein